MIIKAEMIMDTVIKGVRVKRMEEGSLLKKEYFEWTSFPLETNFKTTRIIAGLLQGWHRMLEFDTVEYHEDVENFFFMEGECIMPFCDKKDGKPDMDTIQLVKIEPGTQVEVAAGKCHYVPIPLTDTFKAYVFTPYQEAILLPLNQTITVGGY